LITDSFIKGIQAWHFGFLSPLPIFPVSLNQSCSVCDDWAFINEDEIYANNQK
jgi:hypothetical protein